jgi:hypothetical protein
VGEGLGAGCGDGHPTGKPRDIDGRLQEPGLFADRVDEQPALRPQRDRERDARKAAARPEVDEVPDRERLQQHHTGETVDDVPAGEVGRLSDGGQVDRGVPRHEQPDVIVDRGAGGRLEPQSQRREPVVEGCVVRWRESWKAPDARRERISLAAQAPLLWTCPVPP